jgi:hypothetical protein
MFARGSQGFSFTVVMRFVLVAAAVGLLASAATASAGTTASVRSFTPNLIGDDGGIPPNPLFPLNYGPVHTPLDDAGDAIDAHDGKVSYFKGRYYWVGTATRCGYAFTDASSKGFCGFAIYSSRDLETWHQEPLFKTPELLELCSEGCFSPRLIYSSRLHRYLLWFDVTGPEREARGSYRVAQSRSPAGPWGEISTTTVTQPLANDFDVYVDHRGRGWIVMSRLDFQTPENFALYNEGIYPAAGHALYVERLNADLTSGTGESVRVATGFREAPSIFQRGDTYYISAADPACAYCRGGTGIYMADDPLGPWRTPASGEGSVPGDLPATIVSADSCGGQPRSVSELPSPRGTVYLQQIDLWSAGPPASPLFARFGDRNQGRAGRYWVPLTFDSDGVVRPYECTAVTKVPTAGGTSHRSPPPVSYQQDCRIAANSTISQDWRYHGRRSLTAIDVPMFRHRSPAAADPDGPVTLRLTSGSRVLAERTVPAAEVAYAAFRQRLRLTRPALPGAHLRLSLSTTATTGCYGVLARPAEGPWDGNYVRTLNGDPTVAPQARLQLDEIG